MSFTIDKRSLDEVLRNLNKEISGVKRRCKGSLRTATLLVRRTSQLKTPVDTGNLKASAFSEVYQDGEMIWGGVGYTASYALWVHEATGKLAGLPRGGGKVKKGKRKGQPKHGFFWDPQGQAEPQFLRNALIENHYKIVNLIVNGAKL